MYDADWGDLLTSYGGKTITYDAVGNPLSDGTWSYTWEQGRRLKSMSKNGMTWNFTYGPDGMRTGRSNGTTTWKYTYNGSQLMAMTNGSTKMYFTYDAAGRPVSIEYNGTTYYYVLNAQGDVVAIVNSSGSPVVNYTYNAWGKLCRTTGSMASSLGHHNPLRYRSYVYDVDTGLYYLQSRYYNPEMGRFINADSYASTGQGILGNNMFAYCNNNPMTYSDPLGRFALTTLLSVAIVIGGGTVIGGLLGAFSAATTGGDVVESTIEGALTGAIGATFGLLAPEIGALMALGGAFIFAGTTDIVIQAHFSQSGPADFSLADIDYARACDVGLQTGLGTLIPAFGNPYIDGDAVNAIGTAVAWAEYSALVACADVTLTKIWEEFEDAIADAWEAICIWP